MSKHPMFVHLSLYITYFYMDEYKRVHAAMEHENFVICAYFIVCIIQRFIFIFF